MVNQIKAIETHYKGYRFRSRLEARWAVFFYEAGIPFEYETQGYESGDGMIKYLPDFYLPDVGAFVEVKGGDEALRNDLGRLGAVMENDILPNDFANKHLHNACWLMPPESALLIILGDVPLVEHGIVVHPCVHKYRSTYGRFAWATDTDQITFKPAFDENIEELFRLMAGDALENIGPIDQTASWTTRSYFCRTQWANRHLVAAYKAARSARFEHGESGALAR